MTTPSPCGNLCPTLPAPSCPADVPYSSCHQVSTYDHSMYLAQYRPSAVQQSTPILDQCTSHNQTGKFKQLFGDFEQLKVCGQADILCDLTVDGVLNVTTIQSPTGTVSINDNLAVLGTLNTCTIGCPAGTLTLVGTISVTTLVSSTIISGTLFACTIDCQDPGHGVYVGNGAASTGPITLSTTTFINGTLNACTINCPTAPVYIATSATVKAVSSATPAKSSKKAA